MNATQAHPVAPPASWFVPLDPALGASDPPESPRDYAPVSPLAAAWGTLLSAAAGLALLQQLGHPVLGLTPLAWVYVLGAAFLLFCTPSTPSEGDRDREAAAFLGFCFGTLNGLVSARSAWVSEALLALFAVGQLLLAWLNFHRARLLLPRQF